MTVAQNAIEWNILAACGLALLVVVFIAGVHWLARKYRPDDEGDDKGPQPWE